MNANANEAYGVNVLVAVNLLYLSVFVAVEFVIDVFAADVVVAADDLPLCSSSMGSNFERISSSLFAKRRHCEPLHNRKTQSRLQSEC